MSPQTEPNATEDRRAQLAILIRSLQQAVASLEIVLRVNGQTGNLGSGPVELQQRLENYRRAYALCAVMTPETLDLHGLQPFCTEVEMALRMTAASLQFATDATRQLLSTLRTQAREGGATS